MIGSGGGRGFADGGGSGVGGGIVIGCGSVVSAATTDSLVGGRGRTSAGARLRTLPYTNPATAKPAISTPVAIAIVRSGSEVGRIFSVSTSAATRWELRGGGPASVVVVTPVVVEAASVVDGAAVVVAAAVVAGTAVVVGAAAALGDVA